MQYIDILLIGICGSGLMHGLVLLVYLRFLKKKRALSDVFLELLVLLMALRVGKSIVFQFHQEASLLFILLGLSALLAIGPLLRWYLTSLIRPNFRLPTMYYLQFIPFLAVLTLSPFLTEQWFITHGKYWATVLLLGIYGHLALYLCLSIHTLYHFKKSLLHKPKTKSQVRLLQWLQWVLFGFTIIWCSYILPVFKAQIPYVIGPVLYTLTIYALTYIAYSFKIHELSAKIFEISDEDAQIYQQIVALMETEEVYLSSAVSLRTLSELTGVSSHKISSSINAYAKMNFNNFINQYRIQKAKDIFKDHHSRKYTIAAIAYDIGFSSLSSFNSAFKKFEKTTPSRFRKGQEALTNL